MVFVNRLRLLLSAALPLLLLVSITAAEKEHEKLAVAPASSYTSKQTSEGVTVAADVYETGEKAHAVFGKHIPYDYGVLPILVVIENKSGKAIQVDHMQVTYSSPGEGSIEPTPARELAYLNGARRPKVNPSPIPIPGVPQPSGSRKNPLAEWQIEGYAFSAKVIPPTDSASGFFYFQTGHRSNSKLTVSGIREMGSGRELFYFEIPLARVQ